MVKQPEDNAWKMIEILRREITDLKHCQVQYFSLSVTATGAILGLAATVTTTPDVRGLAMLAPLALLLPCWLIFFDKATTITRLVGFQRAIEVSLKNGSSAPLAWLLAWETALGEFRREQDAGGLSVPPPSNPPSLLRLVWLRTRHRYWMLNWYTFFVLSALSCILGYNFLGAETFEFRLPLGVETRVPERTLWGLPAFLVVISVTIYTFVVVAQLVRGKHSYEANAKAWELLLTKRVPETSKVSGVDGA